MMPARPPAPDVHALARAFLAELARLEAARAEAGALPLPWSTDFGAWTLQVGLDSATAQRLRVEVLRRRTFAGARA